MFCEFVQCRHLRRQSSFCSHGICHVPPAVLELLYWKANKNLQRVCKLVVWQRWFHLHAAFAHFVCALRKLRLSRVRKYKVQSKDSLCIYITLIYDVSTINTHTAKTIKIPIISIDRTEHRICFFVSPPVLVFSLTLQPSVSDQYADWELGTGCCERRKSWRSEGGWESEREKNSFRLLAS